MHHQDSGFQPKLDVSTPKNVPIDGAEFASRLRFLRLARGWTKSELAEASGLSPRTIHEIEAGRRDRVLEKTLLLMAEALGMEVDSLLGSPPPFAGELESQELAGHPIAHIPYRRLFILTLVLMVVLSTVLFLPGFWSVKPMLDAGRLSGVKRVFGRTAWQLDVNAPVEFMVPSPWNSRDVLVGLAADGDDGGQILLIDGRTGKTRWAVEPDIQQVMAAFGPDNAFARRCFIAVAATPVDLHGNGEPVLAAGFMHDWYAPYSIVTVNKDGSVLGQYDHWGHLYEFASYDLDDDGKEELLVSGTNNSPCYQGATLLLLDEICLHGVSGDFLAGGESGFPDSCRTRLVMPSFGEPYMGLLTAQRLEGRHLRIVDDQTGGPKILVSVGVRGINILVTLDRDLRPLSASTSDLLVSMAGNWPEDARANGGPQSDSWLEAWMKRAVRFEAGHWDGYGGENNRLVIESREDSVQEF